MASLARVPESMPSSAERGAAPATRRARDGVGVANGGGAAGMDMGLSAAGALELAILAQRYMLEPLADEAQRQLVARLGVEDVVPLLLRSQEECAAGATEAIFEWAIARYEEVHSQVDHWLGCHPSALPPVPRMLGEKALAAFLENLRTAMLHTRHGL